MSHTRLKFVLSVARCPLAVAVLKYIIIYYVYVTREKRDVDKTILLCARICYHGNEIVKRLFNAYDHRTGIDVYVYINY